MAGAAKSVVKHLDPKGFATESGLRKLLTVLRESPLQKLPVPDRGVDWDETYRNYWLEKKNSFWSSIKP